MTLSETRASLFSSSSGKKGVEVLPLGFEASGSNGSSSRRGSSSGGDSRKKRQQPATTTTKTSKQHQHLQRRYAWDGNKVISLEEEDEEEEEGASGKGGGRRSSSSSSSARRSLEQALAACSRSFFPDPASVSPDYWAYCRWRGAHRLCSSMLSNFATPDMRRKCLALGAAEQEAAACVYHEDAFFGSLAVSSFRFGAEVDAPAP